MVAFGRLSGSGFGPPGKGSAPSSTALASVVRNGAEGGMVNSRTSGEELGTFALERALGLGQSFRRADMHPDAVELHAVALALGQRPVP